MSLLELLAGLAWRLAPRPLTSMDKTERVRAIYLHASLRYVNRQYLTNTSGARTVRHRSPEHRGSVEVDPGGRPRRCNRRPRRRGGTKTDEVRSCLGGQGRAMTYLMASPS